MAPHKENIIERAQLFKIVSQDTTELNDYFSKRKTGHWPQKT